MPPSAVAVLDRPLTRPPARTAPVVRIRRLTDQVEPAPAAWRPRLTLVEADPDGPDRREVHRLLTAVLEILAGHRPASQLTELLPVGPARKLLWDSRQLDTGRCGLRSVRVQRNTATTLELCARVEYGDRSRALVGRLELLAGRWTCTELAMI